MPRKKIDIGNSLERSCPKCSSIIIYKSPYKRYLAETKKTLCRSCSYSIAFNTTESKKKRSINSKIYSNKLDVKIRRKERFQKNNPNKDGKIWKNRKMSNKHKEKLSESKKKLWENPSENMINSMRNNFSCNWNENNPFKEGLTVLLSKKYGDDSGIKKWKNSLSLSMSGEKNPMYGKISKGGIGISGWYKNWFFRSSMELYYMINVIERFGLKWKSAENSENKIEYILNNKKKTYVADFIINDKYLVEIKPKKLQNIFQNLIKKDAAIKFCNTKNLKYKISSCKGYSKAEMINMHNIGFIKIQESKLQKLTK